MNFFVVPKMDLFLNSKKMCFFGGPKNGSDSKFKKKVIFFVVPKMDLSLIQKKCDFFCGPQHGFDLESKRNVFFCCGTQNG